MIDAIKTFKWALVPLLLFANNGHSLKVNGDRVVNGNTLTYQSSAWQTQMAADGLVALYMFDGSGNTQIGR